MASLINTAVPRDRLLCPDFGPEAIALRRTSLDDPHVCDLTAWVATVRGRLDPCHAATVCDFDPAGGGTRAKVMYLAQDPSSTASSTGFISPDNNDATAKATTEACAEASLAPHERVHWNVYPWWLEAPCGTPVPGSQALAGQFMSELLDLLGDVVSVVLIGNKAEEAWFRLKRGGVVREGIKHWTAPHPSRGWWSKPYRPDTDGRLGRDVVVAALREARAHAFAAS